MERRDFLLATAAGSAAVSLPAAILSGIDPFDGARTLAHPTALQTIGPAEFVRELGRAYRTRRPEEDDPKVLAEAIRGNDDGHATDLETHAALSVRPDRRIQADFEEGRTVQLDGWILSVTEARQAALHSILY